MVPGRRPPPPTPQPILEAYEATVKRAYQELRLQEAHHQSAAFWEPLLSELDASRGTLIPTFTQDGPQAASPFYAARPAWRSAPLQPPGFEPGREAQEAALGRVCGVGYSSEMMFDLD